jgi:SAM-dependent methyltransferase
VDTRGFRTGLLAVGERNGYGIPRRWQTVDWADADIVVDLRAGGRLPLEDASQEAIYTAHTVEHLDDDALAALLAECRRVLAPGGVLRLETPDAERIVSAYQAGDRAFLDYFVSSNRENLRNPIYQEDHVVLLGLLSCYIVDDTHVPVVAPKEEVEERLADGLPSFGAWAVSLQSPEQNASGGHVNALWFSKLKRMLGDAGFTTIRRAERGDSAISGLELERDTRTFYSVIVEARA